MRSVKDGRQSLSSQATCRQALKKKEVRYGFNG